MHRSWKRVLLGGVVLVLVAGAAGWMLQTPEAAAEPATITVYKSPTCGCCGKWIDHAESYGFTVVTHDLSWEELDRMSDEYLVPRTLRSCHLSLVEGYVVEGHVPADVIRKMLRERPAIAGIAVPGMPIGSPGMEQGPRREPYSVVAFTASGGTRVYASKR